MKVLKLVPAVAVAVALGAGLAAPSFAQNKGMSNIMTMDVDKDGMVSKAEFLRKMEAMFDSMDGKRLGRLTAKDVQAIIDDIAKNYGTAP